MAPRAENRNGRDNSCVTPIAVLQLGARGYFFVEAGAFCGLGPVQVQPWISQPAAPFVS